jgi:DNA-binding transcriptional LysR family regulator
MRISPAVASNRVKELEKHLGVRLFNRTTRQLMPTEHGTVFYTGAKQVLDAIAEAEAAVSALSGQPRGTIKVTAPLGLGRRLIASGIPDFRDKYPDIEVRLRLSDHDVDIMKEGIDVAFRLGVLEDSSLRMRGIMECERVLAAAPAYLEARGEPADTQDLVSRKHDCLMLRYPGIREHFWTLKTPAGVQKLEVHGPFDSDDGDVLTEWALAATAG